MDLRRSRRGTLLAAAGVLTLVTAAAVYAVPRAFPAAGSAPPAIWWSSTTAAPASGQGGGPVRDPAPAGLPTRVRIASLGIDAPLETLHLKADGTLGVPRDYDRPGWFAEGTRPGDIGPAVIAGHVDSHHGPAVFYLLSTLKPGDLVQVLRGEDWVEFRVVDIGQYAKNRFPTARVYGSTPDPQLRLITCGGDFDRARRSYRDNVVVYAVAV